MEEPPVSIPGKAEDPESELIDLLERLGNQPARANRITESVAEQKPAYPELKASYDCTLLAFARALDQRESARENHTLWLTECTVEVASRLALPEFELTPIRRGALLHDIGNLFIPEKVLLKCGPLTETEWRLIRSHPVNAYRLLSPIPILQNALDIPYSHHEHWDGTGYPLGLSGEAIPFTARIFAILDTWEALTHARPYRSAMGAAQAVALLQMLAGQWFDARLVPVVTDYLHEKGLAAGRAAQPTR